MTLTAAWSAHWRAAPEDVVLVDADTGRTYDGAEVERRSAAMAAGLHDRGIGHGDRVLLSCGPSIDTVLAYVAILRLGAVVVPANTAYTAGELAHIVGDARPVLAVVDDPEGWLGDQVPRETPQGLVLEAAEGPADPAYLHAALDCADDSDVAMIGYTSGTTGRPKGAVLEHRSLRAGAEALVEAWEWSVDDRLVHALPMFHMHGLGAAINGTLTAGASMVVLPRFDPDAVVEAVRAHEATLFFGVPTMYARLRDAGRLRDLAGLRLLVSGSAPLDPSLFQAISEQAGQAPIERYGMTETVMLTSNPVRGERRAGSVGVPLPGVRVRLGDGGAVQVNGSNVFRGYWDRPDATREAFTTDGWFRTGDIGELDDDGYLRLVGRASDLIITGGYNVYPREVEDAILTHPGVADVAVVGVPDDTWGERVIAFVVTRGDLASEGAEVEAALGAHIEPLLAPYKRPRAWSLVTELPRNAMGKVLRTALTVGWERMAGMTRVALVQLDSSDSETPEVRVERAAGLVAGLRDVELAVLPELWSVGAFDLARAKEHAEPLDGPVVTRMRDAARTAGIWLHAGSFPELDRGHRYNTSVIVDPSGDVVATYRKQHLFGWEDGEPSVMTAGDSLVVLPTPLGATGLATCYDLRFPELFRRLVDSGTETFLLASGWPKARIEHWVVLTRARAIEDQAWVIACNSAGNHAGVAMGGRSVVVDPQGVVVAEAGEAEEILYADVDPAAVREWRMAFPALADRRL